MGKTSTTKPPAKKKTTGLRPAPAPTKASSSKARKEASREIAQRIEALEGGGAETTDGASQEASAKPAKKRSGKVAAKPPATKKLSGLDAAAMVLAAARAPMNTKQIYAATQAQGLWTTKGATPEATLYAAITREIAAKGEASRFVKHDRGLFAAKGA